MGFKECPECGYKEFSLTSSESLEKHVNLRTESGSRWKSGVSPYSVREVRVKCLSCGETWIVKMWKIMADNSKVKFYCNVCNLYFWVENYLGLKADISCPYCGNFKDIAVKGE